MTHQRGVCGGGHSGGGADRSLCLFQSFFFCFKGKSKSFPYSMKFRKSRTALVKQQGDRLTEGPARASVFRARCATPSGG